MHLNESIKFNEILLKKNTRRQEVSHISNKVKLK